MHTEQVYALIVDDVIQYPITEEDMNLLANHITNKYYACQYLYKKPIDEVTEYYVELPRLMGDTVIIDYEVKQKTITELFDNLNVQYPDTNTPITSIAPAMLNGFVTIVKVTVQERLDNFAKEKGYDDIKSVCTYYNSTNPTFSSEATTAIEMRDNTWSTLYAFLDDMMSQVFPVPRSWSEIELILPDLTWV